jgi:fucose 4-O-acetylase-like acetyltransferase
MLMSGYFSASSLNKPFNVFIKKKTIQLLIPVISWTIIISLFVLFVFGSRKEAIVELIGGSWFLRTLFACYLYVYLIKKIKLPDYILAISSSFIMFLVPKASFLSFNWMLLFFWSGYFVKKYDTFFEKYRLYITLISLIIYVSVYINVSNSGYALINCKTLQTDALTILIKYIGCFSASIFIINVCYYIYNKIPKVITKTKIDRVGKYTLGIYLLQSFLIARLFPLMGQLEINDLFLYNFVLTPAISLIILFLCLVIIKYTSRNRIVNLLLFGNQY